MPAVALTIAGLSLSLMSFGDKTAKTETSKLAAVTLYFAGNAHDQDEVADPSNWAEDNPASSCAGSAKACSMIVEDSDLQGASGSRTLNPSRIELQAVGNDTNGYKAIKSGGTSSTNPTFAYQN